MYQIILFLVALLMAPTAILAHDTCVWPDDCNADPSSWIKCTKAQMDGDSCPGVLTPSEGELIVREDANSTVSYDRCIEAATGSVEVRCIYREGEWRELNALYLGDTANWAAILAALQAAGVERDEFAGIILTRDQTGKANSIGLILQCSSNDEKCSQLQVRAYDGNPVWLIDQDSDGNAIMRGHNAAGDLSFRIASGTSMWQQAIYSYTATDTVDRSECFGSTLNNVGASGNIILTLPPMEKGAGCKVCVEEAFDITVQPDGTERFSAPATDTAGDYLTNAGTVGDCLSFEATADGVMRVTGEIGNWTEE